MRRLAAAMSAAAGEGDMRGFRFAAAGSDSAVFQRLASGLSAAAGLRYDPAGGEMLLRVRRYGRATAPAEADSAAGWEVLVRLTDRPLSARSWRVCNRPGGVNATVAVAMNRLVRSEPGAAYLNLMCGSGTLLVERAISGPARRIVGIDNEPDALDCARANLAAAGVEGCELVLADVASLVDTLPSGAGQAATVGSDSGARGLYDELTADPPWGDAVGEHAANEQLHVALLAGAATLAAPGAHFALLSHEVRLLERLLPRQGAWRVESSRRLSHGGHRPALLLLRRV